MNTRVRRRLFRRHHVEIVAMLSVLLLDPHTVGVVERSITGRGEQISSRVLDRGLVRLPRRELEIHVLGDVFGRIGVAHDLGNEPHEAAMVQPHQFPELELAFFPDMCTENDPWRARPQSGGASIRSQSCDNRSRSGASCP